MSAITSQAPCRVEALVRRARLAVSRESAWLLPPMLRLVHRISADNVSMYTADHVGMQRPNHPSIFRRDWKRGCKSMTTRRLESMPRIVLRMSENDDELHTRLGETPDALLNELSADTHALSLGHDCQWSEDGRSALLLRLTERFGNGGLTANFLEAARFPPSVGTHCWAARDCYSFVQQLGLEWTHCAAQL